jgi:hypothetical protein
MRTILVFTLLMHQFSLRAQELYPSSEPASNMSAHSIGLRFKTEFYPEYDFRANGTNSTGPASAPSSFRINPEVMWGINKKWMLHADLYGGNMHSAGFAPEGCSMYAKYRFFSRDHVQSHFRMAVYGRISLSNDPVEYDEINLAGDNSGWGGGMVMTQLLHKFALSFTGGYLNCAPDLFGNDLRTKDALNYAFSAGYLFLPFHYKDYKQPNLNLYIEFLGKTNPSTGDQYLDACPALQLILNSIMRFDLIYQRELSGNMLRSYNRIFSFRFEYNFLNAYK